MPRLNLTGDPAQAGIWLPYAKKMLLKLKASLGDRLSARKREPLPNGGEIVVFASGIPGLSDSISINAAGNIALPWLFSTDFGFRQYRPDIETPYVMYPVVWPGKFTIRDIPGDVPFINNPKVFVDYVYGATENPHAIPGIQQYGISYYKGIFYTTDFQYGIVWKFDQGGRLIGGFGNIRQNSITMSGEIIIEALPFTLANIEINEDRMVVHCIPEGGYSVFSTFVFDLSGNLIHRIVSPYEGWTSQASCILNGELIVLWYGAGQVQVFISAHNLETGDVTGYFAVPEDVLYGMNLTVWKNKLYLLVSGHTHITPRPPGHSFEQYTMTHEVLEFDYASGELLKRTDLIPLVGATFDNFMASNGDDTLSFFSLFDILCREDGIYISGNNTLYNNSFLTDFAQYGATDYYRERIRSGVYHFSFDMKYKGNLDKKPLSSNSWITPISLAMKASDKYAQA